MKRSLLLIPVVLLAISSTYGQQTKKMTVVSQLIEKNHVPSSETTLVDGMNVVTGPSANSVISITKYDFTYNNTGQLTTIKSYLVENSLPTDPFITLLESSDKNQLNKVLYGENKMSLDLVYEKNVLQSTEFKDLYYDESRVSTITYNKLDLPGSIEITSSPQYSDPETTSFIYDPNNNVKLVNLDNNKTIYTYDKKKYAFAYLPYAFNISNYLSAYELTFTNYVQQNNVVKIEHNEDLLTTIDYTYNAKDLPLTAKVKTVIKSEPNSQPSIYEYEFVYKEIEVVE